jgi:hypothetical protein
MGYIIVWRPNSRDPFIQTESHYFKEEFSTYQDAKEAAEATLDDDHFRNYAIFEEVTS